MVGAGVGWQPGAEAAEQACDGDISAPAGEVPESDVQRPMAHVVVSPHLALQVLPDPFALVRIAPRQMRRKHQGLGEGRGGADPVGHVFTPRAIVGFDPYGPALGGQAGPLACDDVADAGGAVGWQAKPFHLETEQAEFNAFNAAHCCFPRVATIPAVAILVFAPAWDQARDVE